MICASKRAQIAQTTDSRFRSMNTMSMHVAVVIFIWSGLFRPAPHLAKSLALPCGRGQTRRRLAPVPSDSTALPVSDLTP